MLKSQWSDQQPQIKLDDMVDDDNRSLPTAGLPERRKILIERREELQQRKSRTRLVRICCTIAGVLLSAAGSFALYLHSSQLSEILSLTFIIYGVAAFAIAVTQRTQPLDHEISDIVNELDLLAIPGDSLQQQAHKLLRIEQIQLKRYYDQALNQNSQILYLGALAIMLGFAVIGYSLYYTMGTNAQMFGDKIIVGVLGVVGGVLTNFVGWMYINMFSKIVQTLNTSFSSLVETYRYNFANVLAGNIRDNELREKTLSDLALAPRMLPASGAGSEAHHTASSA